MKAQGKLHINPTNQYDHLFPVSSGQDVVIIGSGKAKLENTLHLMQEVIAETLDDTRRLATKFKGHNVTDTCKKIWEFVYHHIQYKMDKTGVEQVRRPSRTWSDRFTGVDCDCYTVFIGSILTHLGIPFMMRITKYGGRDHFQHVYPIVPIAGGHITIDCVADRFNYEVPYSHKQDIKPNGAFTINGLGGLSGVDELAIGLDALEQPSLPLREQVVPKYNVNHCKPVTPNTPQPLPNKQGVVLSPFRWEDQSKVKTLAEKKEFDLLQFLILSGISIAAGIGVLKLFSANKKNTGSVRNTRNTSKKNSSSIGNNKITKGTRP